MFVFLLLSCNILTGVEVQAGRPLKVTPEDGTLVHISHVSIYHFFGWILGIILKLVVENLVCLCRHRLEIVKERKEKLWLWMWRLGTRSSSWELFCLRAFLRLALICYSIRSLSFLTTGEKEVSTLLDSNVPTTKMNILFSFFLLCFCCFS